MAYLNPTTLLKNLILLAVLLLFACNKEQPDYPDDLIRAGRGLGNINIGDPMEEIYDTFGKGQVDSSRISIYYLYTIHYPELSLIFECTTLDQNPSFNSDFEVIYIEMYDDFGGRTSEGIGIGSLRSEVRAAYGESDDPDLSSSDYFDIGLFGMQVRYEISSIIQDPKVVSISIP